MVVVPTCDLHNVNILSHLSLLHIKFSKINQVHSALFVIHNYRNLQRLCVIVLEEENGEDMLDGYLFCFASFMDAKHFHLLFVKILKSTWSQCHIS